MSASHFVSLANKEAIVNRVHELRNRDNSIKARLGPILKRLWNPKRECAFGVSHQAFDRLAIDFPNFQEVINYWKVAATISLMTNTPFASQPVLLSGSPGVGKSFFVSEAAKAMGLYFDELSLASLSGGFLISGMNIQWAEGSPGFVVNALSKSNVANPMLLLDELDKCNDSRYQPLGALYTLFEKHSAKRFKDEALEFEVDASHIVWVTTANNVDLIPEPILSRMKCFHINKPTTQEMYAVVNKIYRSLVCNSIYGQLLEHTLPIATIEHLIHFEPRTAKNMLEAACMQAIFHQRSQVFPSDIPGTSNLRHQSIGFIGA